MQSRGAGGFPVATPFACLVSTETGNPIRQAETEEVIYKHTLFTIKMLSVSHFCVCVLLTLCEKVDLY